MQRTIERYLLKLQAQQLLEPAQACFIARDDLPVTNRPLTAEDQPLLGVMDRMSIGSLLFGPPAEPDRGILAALVRYDDDCRLRGRIIPRDSETRTFLHDIPVVTEFTAAAIADALRERRTALVRDRGIITYGSLTPEQAYISYSSVCFSTFVKFLCDSMFYLEECDQGTAERDAERIGTIASILKTIMDAPRAGMVELSAAVPEHDDAVLSLMAEAGRAVVGMGLVDSTFGNISCIREGNIFISQTGSALDELEGAIDKVPLDATSSVGITASSELPTHRRIHEATGMDTILHGHPKFAVVMSLLCRKEGCDLARCHTECQEKRKIAGVPVVPGEIGTGPTGIVTSVPEAMKETGCAIVYGHGVFAAGYGNFREPLERLAAIETCCRDAYAGRARELLSRLR